MAPIGRTVKQPQPAIIQWDNGRGKWRELGERSWSQWPNFHVESGRNEEFDRAMHAAGVPRIEFFHPAKNGRQTTITQDWMLGAFIGLHPITAGPPADKVSSITLDPAMMPATACGQGRPSRSATSWPEQTRSSGSITPSEQRNSAFGRVM
ncbi:hypothetical protein SE17_24785 [Kouleothrix aurantiaca]|uniref:Uncharacterized protein n=1 Tax=Kouleothrix aurantiaca TaxID=186479 RepID=A0A0N8PRT3_9CHLR|nr:hypothetical protein SE17_24785 [Kouleothrix aurantiaca]